MSKKLIKDNEDQLHKIGVHYQHTGGQPYQPPQQGTVKPDGQTAAARSPIGAVNTMTPGVATPRSMGIGTGNVYTPPAGNTGNVYTPPATNTATPRPVGNDGATMMPRMNVEGGGTPVSRAPIGAGEMERQRTPSTAAQ